MIASGARRRSSRPSGSGSSRSAQGIITLAGYILGFPADTVETIRRDIEIIKRELAVDMLEFFCLTPLPGS